MSLDLKEAVAKFRIDPGLFLRVMLNVENPEDWQLAVMNDVATGKRRISVRSGRRVGKTALLDWLSIWYPMTRPDARVLVTAPSSAQLEDAYIPGFRTWAQKLPPEIFALWHMTSDRFVFQLDQRQGFENFVTVRTARADSPESLQGVNATNVLVLIDEAAGVPDVSFEAVSGSLATGRDVGGESSIVLTGNPNRSSGFFWETHTKLADRWQTYHVNSEKSRRVSQDWIEEKREQWGIESNAYRIHVLGEFPLEEEDTVIPVHLVESAILRDVKGWGPVVWGVDVARFGSDATALCKRQGKYIIEPIRVWKKHDTMEVVGIIKSEWDVTAPAMRPVDIFIDSIGVGGGVGDRLREMGLPARDVNVSELPANPMSKGDRLRDDLWLQVRDWLSERDVGLPNDERLRTELIMPQIFYTSTGAIKVESKDRMKSRGKPSPNCADALCLTFAGAAAGSMGKRFDRKSSIKRFIKGIV
jgi:phage terminase large subunit